MEGHGSKRKFKIPNVDELVLSPSQPKRLFKPTRLRSEPGEHQTESVTGKAYADYIVQQCSRAEGPAVAPPLPNERVGGGGSLEDCAVTKPEIKDVPMDGSTCRGTDLLSELPGTSEVPATRGLGQNASDGPSGVIPRAVGKTNSLLVNPRQRGNPVLKHFRNVPWEFSDIVPDYVMGQTSCTLFLSLRYHHLNPDYIHERLHKLGPAYDLRVLLVQVDVKDPHRTLKELAKMCVLADCTLILAWSSQEAANYLETYKAYENKPADLLKEKTDDDYLSRVTDCLTTVKSINRTDVLTLVNTFGSIADIIKASKEDLSLCPGLGPQKAHRLNNVFLEKFERSRIPSLDGR